jgi:steroid delta-isomerase-like uncharacterized protein
MSGDNKAFIRRWFDEVWNKKRTEAIDEMMDANCVVAGLGQPLRGPAEFKAFHAAYIDAFPDVEIRVEQIVGEGDIVAARWSGGGTHRGAGLGFAATHKSASFSGMTFARVENGKLVEGWNAFDQLGLLQQLGVVKLPA